jgi:hypothetical protein
VCSRLLACAHSSSFPGRFLNEHNGDREAADEAFEMEYASETAQGYRAVLDRIRADRKASGASKSRQGKKSSAPAPTLE